jgi:hypothetical protein
VVTNSVLYQDLLLRLEKEFGTAGFNSTLASFSVGQDMRQTSNDLRRLHGMGFLKREKRKRPCVINIMNPKKPLLCNKGFEYSYSFSKQGISYLNWLKKWRQIENTANVNIISSITRYATKEDADKFLDSIGSRLSSKFKGSRSWWSMDPGLLNWMQSSVAQLETKNQQLETQNYQLERDISDYKKRPSETFKMAEDAFSAIKSTINTISGSSKIANPALVQCKMSVETNEAWFERRFKVFKALCNLD